MRIIAWVIGFFSSKEQPMRIMVMERRPVAVLWVPNEGAFSVRLNAGHENG